MRRLFPLLCCLFAIPANAQSFDASKLDTLFNRLEKNNKAMGAVLLEKNGKTLYQRGFGSAVITGGKAKKNTPETVFRIGSISKMFTGVMVFKLIEEGKLSPDTKLAEYFPEVPNAKDITIDMMLNHHSGIFNLTEDTSFTNSSDKKMTEQQILSVIDKATPAFAPGAKAEYSNTNFILLSYIVEKLRGKDFGTVLQEEISGPLKLQHTRFGNAIDTKKNEAASYAWEGGHWEATGMEELSGAAGAGGISSTVGDMAAFLDALFAGKLVSQSSLKSMMDLKDGYGRAMFRSPWGRRGSWGHNGHIDAYIAQLSRFQDDSLTISAAVNGLNYDFNDIMIGVLSIYYGDNKEYELPDFSKKAVAVSPELLKAYEGVYNCADIGMKLTVKAADGAITAQATGQSAFPMEAGGEGEFSFDAAGIRIKFDEPKDGKSPRIILYQGGNEIPFVRVE